MSELIGTPAVELQLVEYVTSKGITHGNKINSIDTVWEQGLNEDTGLKDDLLIMAAVAKPDTTVWDEIDGWNLFFEYSGGSGEDYENRKGNTKLTVWTKKLIRDGELIDYPIQLNNDNNAELDGPSCCGTVALFRKDPGAVWKIGVPATGMDVEHDTSFSATTLNLPLEFGDMLIVLQADDSNNADIFASIEDEGLMVGDNEYSDLYSWGESVGQGWATGVGGVCTLVTDEDETGGAVTVNVTAQSSRSVCGPVLAFSLRASRIGPLYPDLVGLTQPPFDGSNSIPVSGMCTCGKFTIRLGNTWQGGGGLQYRCVGCRFPYRRCICG